MSRLREALSTIADFYETETGPESGADTTFVRKTSLSGGQTMWRARLILSTLPPESDVARRLRSAIRRGDKWTADQILSTVFDQRTGREEGDEHRLSTPSSERNTTVLPPAPGSSRRFAS